MSSRRITFVLAAVAVLVAACGGAGASVAPSVTVAPTPVPSPGQTRTDAHGITQVWVPAGAFTMGSTDEQIAAVKAANPPDWMVGELPSEQPAHEVTLTQGYWIDKDEVTNDAFQAFVDASGYTTQTWWSPDGWAWVDRRDPRGLPKRCEGDAPDVPRRCITWFEAEAYAAWRGGRLPTEAEWEFAARGPESRIYPWGEQWEPAMANVADSDGPKPVGSYPDAVSWVGANDMSGNAMEWVSDWLAPYDAAGAAVTDPTGPATGEVKVEKGGWWGSDPAVARSAYRHFEDPPTYSDKHIGVRVVSPS